jgi:hypothetical protein
MKAFRVSKLLLANQVMTVVSIELPRLNPRSHLLLSTRRNPSDLVFSIPTMHRSVLNSLTPFNRYARLHFLWEKEIANNSFWQKQE